MGLSELSAVWLPEIESTLRASIASLPQTEMRDMLAYHMGWAGEGAGAEAQGKRIRPLLVLLVAQAVGGDWRSALPATAAVELLHNFSLIHDDIQDRSTLRRGRPTVWVRWGEAQAINAGDVMFTLAFSALQDLEKTLSPQVALTAGRIFQKACLDLTEGQYLDLSYETRSGLTESDYWPMITGKTSALLGACAELGALAGSLDEKKRADFRSFGISLGLAFQTLDDWLGIWGNSALTGKSTESDLVAGKKSLPVLYALEQSPEFSRRWSQGTIQPAEVQRLANEMAEAGADRYTLETAARLTDEALGALHRAVPTAQDRSALEELATVLLRREK